MGLRALEKPPETSFPEPFPQNQPALLKPTALHDPKERLCRLIERPHGEDGDHQRMSNSCCRCDPVLSLSL